MALTKIIFLSDDTNTVLNQFTQLKTWKIKNPTKSNSIFVTDETPKLTPVLTNIKPL